MSIQTCEQFFALVNTDRALQQEVNTALEGKEGDEAANAFVWVGAKHGFEFTAEEATQKHQEIIAAAEGELDDEALEQVAGGAGNSTAPPQLGGGRGAAGGAAGCAPQNAQDWLRVLSGGSAWG